MDMGSLCGETHASVHAKTAASRVYPSTQNGAASPSSGVSGTVLPGKNADYLSIGYWDQRYTKEDSYEWFKGYGEFRQVLLPQLAPADRILVLGCGNSSMTEDLYRDGFHNITSTDLSEVVIQRMQHKAAAQGMGGITWQVADMLALPFPTDSFDVVLEKGTMDVLFVDSDSPWNPQPAVKERAFQMLNEVHRVLTASGKLISMTFAQPHFRRPFFLNEAYSWDVRQQTIGETFHYFVYTLTKGARSAQDIDPGFATGVESHIHAVEGGACHEHMDSEDYLTHISL